MARFQGWLVLAMMGVSLGADAAQRRHILFSGNALSEASQGKVQGLNLRATCTVVLSNLSSSTQQVTSLSFLGFDLSAGTAGRTLANRAPGQIYRFTPTSDSSSCATLPANSHCVAQYQVETILMGGNLAVCAGAIDVQDADANAPGSMVASGSVKIIQEAQVLGGVLSGAYYASGSHANKSSPNLAPASGSHTHTDLATHNMNIYCAHACRAHLGAPFTNAKEVYCENHCGHVGARPHPTTYVAGNQPASGISHWSEPGGVGTGSAATDILLSRRSLNANEYGFRCELANKQPWYLQTDPDPAFDGTIEYTGGPASVGAPSVTGPGTSGILGCAANVSEPELWPQHVIRTAAATYAGGMVMEMQMGAFTSICSANAAYFEQGGTEFTHYDGAIYQLRALDANGQMPPERLLCNHRHGNVDLYLGVGTSSPFAINGGMPF